MQLNKNLLNLAKRNRVQDPESWEKLYESEIIRKIRTRYTVNQELAILRQRDTKPREFAEYNAFVEKCKKDIKEELQI